MKRFFQFLLFVFLLSSAVSALYVWKTRRGDVLPTAAGGKRTPEKFTTAEGPTLDLKDVNVLAEMSRQQTKLASAVIPSVVSVSTQKVQRQRTVRDPFAEFFGLLDPSQRQGRVQSSLGSGAIVSKEGHIVTNNHVIDGMDQIKVQLHDGREFPARLIGAAPANDLAILKIDAGDLTPLPFGNSDAVQVGEMVYAVGNPFGLEETLTQGIISAKGRRAAESGGEFFQTDAAINPGNSGGPLVSVRGELVGINTMIYSQTGGSVGIGFAIPSAVVKRVLESVLKTGRVIRPYLGITPRDLTPALAQSLGIPDQRGAVVAEVGQGTPAEAAGLLPRDVITKFNEKPVRDALDLRNRVLETEIDAKVPIELLREGKPLTLTAQVRELPADATRVNPVTPGGGSAPQVPPQSQPQPPGNFGFRQRPNQTPPSAAGKSALSGVDVADVTPKVAARLNVPADLQGVVVQRVDESSPAAAVLRESDIIEEVNQQAVTDSRGFQQAIAAAPAGRDVLLSIVRDRARSFVVIPSPR